MAERAVRIFVSSTFRDMHFDREVIVKQVFPELHRYSAFPACPNIVDKAFPD